ncbi:MAG TPA: tRNA-dihydrouridine synthase family protein, partial [Petrotogaceae bacterium]|nr:tRNA-dihydrouridine synthase family protein [Petrotogaceae bacterium]
MLNGKVGLAPMADYSDYPFRKICSKFGAEFTFTEMISSEGIVRNNSRTYEMLPQDDEKNIGVQIFGSSISVMVESARKVQKYGDWIDINAGCPVTKVVRRGAGSALLLYPEKLAYMIREIRKSVSKPLGVKVRIGYEKDNMQ